MEAFTFRGNMTLDLTVHHPEDTVVLNVLDITVDRILHEGKELEYSIDLAAQTLTIKLGRDLSGDISLMIEYRGEINDKLAGLYRSQYQVDGENRFVAVTQFQESDARRAFPCFDTPELKATFDISYTLPSDFVAISNTSILQEQPLADDLKRVTFERTPKMSTYLVFFGFGEFEWIEEKYKSIPIRVVASPGKPEKYGGLGMDYGKKSLEYCEEYFAIDYPLSKMDLIATPAFAAGAMENWGAILFRENALLYYPGMTTEGGKASIKNVIAHEIAHQWFGNLVSPDKWKFVWLNESFATYFAYKTINHFEPEYGIFDYFVQGTTNGALTADGYHETAPIEQAGDEPAAYTVKTVPILYSKGGSVLRQLEGFLGDVMFRDGLRHYLKKHEYDVAGSTDLWQAFEDVSGKPISKMMEGWVMQMGYPIVSATRMGTSLSLSQKRYTYMNREYDTKWMIPITIRQYLPTGTKDDAFLMSDSNFDFVLDPSCTFFKINIDHTGFYRVLYDVPTYQVLGEQIKDKTLGSMDRFNIENDLYAFMRSGHIDLTGYLDFLGFFSEEDNHLPLGSISNHLNSLYNLLDGDAKEKVAAAGRPFYNSVLSRIGYEPREGEHHTITIMRAPILFRAAKFGSEDAKQFAMDQFAIVRNGGQINANILNAVLQVGALETNDWDFFANKFKTAESEAEKQYYLVAMYTFTDPALIERLQMFAFEEVPPRGQGTAVNVLCQNDAAKDGIWEWFLANLDNFGKMHPFIQAQSLTSVIVASVKYRAEVEEFMVKYVQDNPTSKDSVDKALETLDINSSIKTRYET
jgi:tricorn protease interacting factor F2/3